MLQMGLAYFKDTPLTIAGMLIFFLLFGGLTVWTLWGPRGREFYGDLAARPLNEEGE